MDSIDGGHRQRRYGRNQGRRIQIKFLGMDIGSQNTNDRCSETHVSLQDHLPQVWLCILRLIIKYRFISNLYIKYIFIHNISIFLHNIPNPEEIIRFTSEQQFIDHWKSEDTYEQF